MSAKSAKPKPAAPTKQDKVVVSWIDALEAITINEQDWRCMIVMIVETLPEHTEIIELFDEAAEKGSRKAIYPLTFKKVISSIKTLSKVDQDKCPPAQGVFHHANKLVTQNDNLDAGLVAKLVKYLVYRGKTETIARTKRELNRENEFDQELRAMLTVGKVELQHSKKSAQSVEPQEKTTTHLQKFGEECRDKVYIDDAPRNGPDLYVILTGFRDPVLPLELIKAGVPLTCILKIKRPGETLDLVKTSQTDVDNDHKCLNVAMKHVSRSDVIMKKLHDFWCTLDKSSNDPENLGHFSSVIFRTFCPPQIPSTDSHEEAEELKKDMYDRVSCIVYDLHDLQCLHIDYLRSIKLENVPEDFSKDRQFTVYRSIMDAVPAECSFVSVILQAMLAQIEADFQEGKSPLTETAVEAREKSKLNVKSISSEDSTRQESCSTLSGRGNLTNHYRAKLRGLNLQYGITLKHKQLEMQKKDPEVILEDDKLRSKTYHVRLDDDVLSLINPTPSSLADLAMRSLQDPRVIDLWKFCEEISEEAKKKNRYRINKLTGCFGGSVDSRSFVHYLHLQVFDKMIHGRLNRAVTRCEDRRVSIMRKGCPPGARRSDPFLLSTKTIQDDPTSVAGENPISNLRAFGSDSIIDYSKTAYDIFQCPELLTITDTREMLQPGFLETWTEKLLDVQPDQPSVAEFTDVRILSKNVFLQMIHECLCSFKDFQYRYVEITDSMLLYFSKGEEPFGHDDPCNGQTFRIITPVCLRNFSEYVMYEEDKWIRETEKERARTLTNDVGELTRKLSQHSDIDTVKVATFTDNDFILPNSLKGQARKRLQENSPDGTGSSVKTVKPSDTVTNKSEVDKKDLDKKRKKSAPRSSRDKNSKDFKTMDIELTSLPASKVSTPNARHEESYKFVGYDLGNRRVHLTTQSETFVSMDGTLVQVDRDQWLYEKKRLGIGVHHSGCFLKLENIIGNEDSGPMPFHFITENGIVVAFNKIQEEDRNQNCGPCFDFRASWPSSLLVEPVRDDSVKNSFYILQRYITKGPECELVSRENYRKFLRNGTVLKFFDDDAVEVMRPNGTIVRCLKLEKLPGSRDSELGRDGELTKVSDEILKYKKSRSLMSMRGQQKASSPRKQSRRLLQDDQSSRTVTNEEAARGKITRYTALEHDGRHYEMVNDKVSRVFDGFPVRTNTDFEVSEKFTQRGDGMQSILNSMGELIVSFPDGTRITTGFVIEPELLICDWSDEEFNKFFEDVPTWNFRRSDRVLSSRSGDVSWPHSYRSAVRRSTSRIDRLRKLLDDAFVSILMTCRMEHKCYTTVAYDQADQSCKLSMPDELVIRISREGLYNINVGSNIELQISNDNLTYLSSFSENGQRSDSTSIYDLRQPELRDEYKRVLFETVDSLGRVFKVYADGTTVREDGAMVEGKIPQNSKQHRLFAMNRDFTAYEYLYKSKRDEYRKKINSSGKSSVISVAIPNRAPGHEYRLFLKPLEPANYSKMWLNMIPEFKPTNHDRTDLLRSTYSTPYNWLFPFGRNGNGVRKNTWKVPIVELIQEGHAELLTLAVFQNIQEEGKNVLIELQKALACYWHTTTKELEVDQIPNLEDEYPCYGTQMENWVRELALGTKTNIPLETYLSGMSPNPPKLTTAKIRRTSVHVKTAEEKMFEKAEIQWYREYLRDRIILPYFEHIQGSCFLWVMSCLDEALELVKNS